MKKPLVILDLDNTLIYSTEYKIPGLENYKKLFDDMWTYERPYLQDFLDWLFSRYLVAVWTAGTFEYAVKIVAEFVLPIDRPSRRIQFLYHRTDVEAANQVYGGLKHLEFIRAMFPGQFGDTVIIDDHIEVKATNGNNCIRIKEYGGSQTINEMLGDRELIDIIKKVDARI